MGQKNGNYLYPLLIKSKKLRPYQNKHIRARNKKK